MSIETPDINIIPKEEVPEKKDEQIPKNENSELDEERIAQQQKKILDQLSPEKKAIFDMYSNNGENFIEGMKQMFAISEINRLPDSLKNVAYELSEKNGLFPTTIIKEINILKKICELGNKKVRDIALIKYGQGMIPSTALKEANALSMEASKWLRENPDKDALDRVKIDLDLDEYSDKSKNEYILAEKEKRA